MKIRRFNENQAYLTEPFDPEMHTYISTLKFFKEVDKSFKDIANRLGLRYYQEKDNHNRFNYIFNNEKLNRDCKFHYEESENYLGLESDEECQLSQIYPKGGFTEMGEIEEYIKKYFELYEN